MGLDLLSALLILIVLFLIFFQVKYVEKGNLASVPGLLLLTYIVGVLLRTIYIYSVDNHIVNEYLMLGKGVFILSYGMVAISIGLVFWSFGYVSANNKSIKLKKYLVIIDDNYKSQRLVVPIVIMATIGVCIFFAYSQKMGINLTDISDISKKRRIEVEGGSYKYASLGYYLMGMLLIPISFLISFIKALEGGGKKYSLICAALLVIWIVINTYTSSRFEIISLLIVSLVVYQNKMGKVEVGKIIKIGVVSVCIFLVLGGVRKAVQEDRVNKDFVIEYMSDFADSFLGNRNWLDITKTSHIVENYSKDGDLLYGASLVSWLVAPVPRTVWNDKPLIRYGPLLGEEVFGRTSIKTGVPPGIIGESYWNYGWFGIIIVMFLVGYMTRVVINTLKKESKGRYLTSILLGYATIALSLTIFAGELAGAFLLIGKILFCLFLAKLIVTLSSFLKMRFV